MCRVCVESVEDVECVECGARYADSGECCGDLWSANSVELEECVARVVCGALSVDGVTVECWRWRVEWGAQCGRFVESVEC